MRDEERVLDRLCREAQLSPLEGQFYLRLLKDGSASAGTSPELTQKLMDRGMVIESGDGKRVIPVHPRLGIANQYRVWREMMVKEINERRMRVDRLILELIPLYEAATEKKTHGGGR